MIKGLLRENQQHVEKGRREREGTEMKKPDNETDSAIVL